MKRTRFLSTRDALLALTCAVGLAGASGLPAAAAPATAAGATLKANVEAPVLVHWNDRRVRRSRAIRSGPRYAHPADRDTVGSIAHDGYGYGYNRFSGQRYFSCVFDEGYGRTRPCDAGGAPN